MSYQCKKCGSEVSEDALFCSKCGEKITALRCPNCGKRLPEDSAFCTYCGTKIAGEQAESTQPEDTAESVPQDVDQPAQEQPLDASHPDTSDQEQQPIQSDAASSSEETEKEDIQFDEQPSTVTARESVVISNDDSDEATDNQHHYHLTRRVFTFRRIWSSFSNFESTDFDISDSSVLISDSMDTTSKEKLNIADLQQVSAGMEVSPKWLCIALFFTFSCLFWLVRNSSVSAAEASPLFFIAFMSWIMTWQRKITLYCRNGKRIAVRGREKDVMLELKQDILSRIVPEQDYVGDFSDIVAKNTQYYFPEFEKVEQNEKCRFNWAAFFLNGSFAYYRKSQEIFWYYYRWPIIIYAVIALGIAGTGCLAVTSEAGLMGWFVAAGLLSVAINIYMLVTNIRFGKNFNRDYYQHCMALVENSEITPRTVGTSVKNAVLYLIVVSFCAWIIGVISASLIGTAILGEIPDDLWDSEENLNTNTTENISNDYIWDKAGILADEDQIALILQINDVMKTHNCGIYIITISSASNSGYIDASDAAQKMYSELKLGVGSDHNGVLLLISTEERQFSVVSFGDYAETAFDNNGIQHLQDIAKAYFKNDDWYGGLSSYVGAAEELLDEMEIPANTSLTISNFVGDYTYDASFGNPDGTDTDFCYSLQVIQAIDGINVSLEWRGNRIFGDVYISNSELTDGNTVTFYAENYQTDYDSGYHSLTYVPASKSPYGSDTIYVDGDKDMPFIRDSYAGSTYSDWGSSDSYILPTDTQYITAEDLYGMSKEQVSLARNEIYARYGYSFKSISIHDYFMQQSWYHENPNVNANTFGINYLNDCERANLETIQQYERDMGWK